MEKLPIHDDRLIEAIEVCRLDRDDLSDPVPAELLQKLADHPELAERYERLKQCDAKLGSAFRSVAVPDGLDQRLLASLEQARAENAAGQDQEEEVVRPTEAGPKRPWRRRRLLAAGAGLAAAASLLIAATIYIYGSQPYTESSVLEESVVFFQVESAEPEDGKLIAHSRPPEAYPFSRSVGKVPRMRWRPIADFLGREGIAYDLPLCDQATLYVVRRTVPKMATTPPLRPQKNTGGLSAATWQEGELLYVLVVRGKRSNAAYRSLVDLPQGPLI